MSTDRCLALDYLSDVGLSMLILDRSDSAWKKAFADAGLKILKEEVQQGFPEGLYAVKTCVSFSLILVQSLTITNHRYALR